MKDIILTYPKRKVKAYKVKLELPYKAISFVASSDLTEEEIKARALRDLESLIKTEVVEV